MTATDKFAAAFGLLLLVALPLWAFLYPSGFAAALGRDALDGTGLFEHLTVLVLLPGIICGFCFAARIGDFRRRGFLALWALALLYFAGEEASWGQWYFGWQTPDWFLAANDQGETNLHNMSSWLDQKPRILIEVFIFIGGLLIPIYRHFRGLAHRSWYMPSAALIPLALAFIMARTAYWLPQTQTLSLIANSELREFLIACYLSCYVIRLALFSLTRKDNF